MQSRLINLQNLSDIDAEFLNSFLFSDYIKNQIAKGNREFADGIKYPFKDKQTGIEKEIELSHTILYTPKKNLETGKIENKYSVFDNDPLGSGNYGKVKRVIMVLTQMSSTQFSIKTKKNTRAAKIQLHIKDRERSPDLSEAKKEAYFSYLAPHFKSRDLIVRQHENDAESFTSYLFLREFPGHDLACIADKKNAYLYPLTIEQRLLLSRNILRAIQEQIHNRGLVHRDIKPANIKVDIETGEVNIMDVGLSIKSSESRSRKNQNFIGTPPYAAHEVIYLTDNESDNSIDESSDVSSAALTLLSGLWGANERKFGGSKNTIEAINYYQKNHVKQLEDVFNSLFPESKSLTTVQENINQSILEEEKESITRLFKAMLDTNKDNRPSLNDAIQIFDELLLNRKLQHIDKEEEQSLINAHEIGIKARHELREIAHKNKNESLYSIYDVIKNSLDTLTSESELQEFVDVLGVNADLKSKNDDEPLTDKIILNNVGEIIRQFYKNEDTLLAMLKRAEEELDLAASLKIGNKSNREECKIELESLIADIRTVISKHEVRQASLDDINAMNHYFEKSITRLTTRTTNLDLKFKTLGCVFIPLYVDILNYPKDLNKNQNETDTLTDKLKHMLICAIKEYLESTLTPGNINKSNRAASPRRSKDIHEIIKIINEHHGEPEDLIAKIHERLHKLKGGVGVKLSFTFHGKSYKLANSQLHDNIQHAIEAFNNLPKLNPKKPKSNSGLNPL